MRKSQKSLAFPIRQSVKSIRASGIGGKLKSLEKNFQRRVLLDLKKLPHTWFYKASDRVKKGIPDVILCVNGFFIAMELKRSDKEKATPLQLHTLGQISDAHGEAWVVYPENWDETYQQLKIIAGAK